MKKIMLLALVLLLASCGENEREVVHHETPVCTDMAAIQNGSYVTLTVSAKDVATGQNIDTGSGSQTLRIGSGLLPKGLERLLSCKREGETLSVDLAPEDAYGPAMRETTLVRAAFGPDRDKIEEDGEYEVAPGMRVKVLSIDGENVTVEAPSDHPLAGKTLHYDVSISHVVNAAK